MDIKFTSKEKAKWYQVRERIAYALVRLASKIYPDSPEVRAFYIKLMVDHFIYGGAMVRVDPTEYIKAPGDEPPEPEA